MTSRNIFQKKAKQGIKAPQQDVDVELITQRLKNAKALQKAREK